MTKKNNERSNNNKPRVHKSHFSSVTKFKGNSFRETSSSILFSDGNPMSFALIRQKIEDRFFQSECLELIAYDPANVADPPVETAFTDQEPTEINMVTNTIANNRASTVIHWAAINNLVNLNAAGIGAAELAKTHMQNAQKELEALRAVDMTSTSLTNLFHTAHATWVRNKDKHATKQANCSKIFYNTFVQTL